MKRRLLVVAMIIAYANSHTIPTQDTIVVARSDETTPLSDSEVTTEEPNAPIKLTDMVVRSEISLRYAHTSVVTHVRNPARKAQETTFHVLLPDTAFISGFVMTLNGTSYKAYVKEKEEAKKIYTDAVSQGIGAAHIAAKARDSNHFTVVVNVEPNTKATFNLTYEEALVRRNGVYNHAINLHPGALVPRMEVTVHIKEFQKIKLLRVPEVRTGNEIDATENDAQNSGAVIRKSDDKKEATITFTPDLEEQKRLIRIYADKSKKSQSSSYHRYTPSDVEEDKKEGAIGQFVVQYDVERSSNGEVILNDGYFVHFFAPQSLQPLSKYVVFVLDTSGSMMGRKIVQLRDAMKAILADLNPTDYFSLIEFNSDVTVHKLKEADEAPVTRKYSYYWYRERTQPVELVPPSPATPENIAKAQIIVSRLEANGGTNIYEALKVATEHVHKASYDSKTENETTTEVSATKETPKAGDLEPIIIFLTDGDPTVGETSTARIISHMTENNSGEKKATLYCLAFGEDADRTFLRKLALRNEGFMRHIYEAADAELQLRDFYRQVSSPLLSKVRFVYPPNQIKEGSVTRHKYTTIYDGGEVIVAGELAPGTVELASSVEAFCMDPKGHGRKRFEIRTVGSGARSGYLPLERLWAYLTIKQLLDERDISDEPKAAEKRALEIALKYSFVTPLTSLVVVKPNATNAVNAESADGTDGDQNVPSFGSYLMPGQPGQPGLPGYPMSGYQTAALPTHSLGGGYAQSVTQGLADRQALRSYIAQPPAMSVLSASLPAAGAAGAPLPLGLDYFTDIRLEEEEVDDAYSPSRFYKRPIALSAFGSNSHNMNRMSGWSNRIVGGHISSYDSYDNYDTALLIQPSPTYRPTYLSTPAPAPATTETSAPVTAQAPITTPAPTTTSAPTTTQAPTTTTSSLPSEDEYHLGSYKWALSLLNSETGSLEFLADGKNVTLELSKELNGPTMSSEEPCSKSTSAAPATSVCVYLTRCDAATNMTADEYRTSYCYVNQKYAGVCCPEDKVATRQR